MLHPLNGWPVCYAAADVHCLVLLMACLLQGRRRGRGPQARVGRTRQARRGHVGGRIRHGLGQAVLAAGLQKRTRTDADQCLNTSWSFCSLIDASATRPCIICTFQFRRKGRTVPASFLRGPITRNPSETSVEDGHYDACTNRKPSACGLAAALPRSHDR